MTGAGVSLTGSVVSAVSSDAAGGAVTGGSIGSTDAAGSTGAGSRVDSGTMEALGGATGVVGGCVRVSDTGAGAVVCGDPVDFGCRRRNTTAQRTIATKFKAS